MSMVEFSVSQSGFYLAANCVRKQVRFTPEGEMTLKRMDNVLIVVDDLEAVKTFFIELGLELEGETTVEGPLVGRAGEHAGHPSHHVRRR
jgi:hypothetical protein